MHVDYRFAYPVDGVLTPNWREQLECTGCALNGRMRGVVHAADALLGIDPSSEAYLTEAMTPLASVLKHRLHKLETSEFVDSSLPPGSPTEFGVRHEDLTELSFADSSFDTLLSFDVLEHVPEYRRALGECRRVLRPGGQLLLTTPFLPSRRKNLVRARLTSEGIEHLEPPEYHGDPLRSEGVLSFYHFGWQLLGDLKLAGFRRARLVSWRSLEFGYLGPYHLALWATA